MDSEKNKKLILDLADQLLKADRDLKDAIIGGANGEEIMTKRIKFKELAVELNRQESKLKTTKKQVAHLTKK